MFGLDPPGLNSPPGFSDYQVPSATQHQQSHPQQMWRTGSPGEMRGRAACPGAAGWRSWWQGGRRLPHRFWGGFPRNVRSIPSLTKKRIGQRPLEICLCAFPFQVICRKTEYDNDGARPERKVSATRHGERGKRCVLSFVTSERESCPGFWSADPALGHRHPWASPSSPPGEVAATV